MALEARGEKDSVTVPTLVRLVPGSCAVSRSGAFVHEGGTALGGQNGRRKVFTDRRTPGGNIPTCPRRAAMPSRDLFHFGKIPAPWAEKMTVSDSIETGLTALLADIPDPVSAISRDFQILWANNTVLDYLQCELDCIRGRFCYRVLVGARHRCVECPVTMVFEAGRAAVLEKCFMNSCGPVIWREVRAYPVRDETGSIIAAIRIGFDITEKKRLRDRQASQVEELERALRDLQEAGVQAPGVNPKSKEAYGLTSREMHVLRLLTQGFTNRQISGVLCISQNTVKSHVAHIFNKLGVVRRSEATAKAFRLKLV